MSSRRNYYEIIDSLSFDPPEKNEDVIIRAVDLWRAIEGRRIAGSDDREKERELELYEDIKACLTDEIKRSREADMMKQKQIKRLHTIISAMKEKSQGESVIIPESLSDNLAKALRLDVESTVNKVFIDCGCHLKEQKNANIGMQLFITPSLLEVISNRLKKLVTLKDDDKPWLSKVSNLYELAAYTANDEKNIDKYQQVPADKLKKIMEIGSMRVSKGNLSQVNFCLADLYNAGRDHIFKDEKSKEKYNNSLKISKLDKYFNVINTLPEDLKKTAAIADGCINKIRKIFPDKNTAIGIYNYKTGQLGNAYEPYEGDNVFSCEGRGKIKFKIDGSRMILEFE